MPKILHAFTMNSKYFNIWYYQRRKCFLQNSMINIMYVAMVTFVPLYLQFSSFCFSSPELKAYWWAYRIGWPPSSVIVHTLQTSSPQKPLGQTVKFQREPPWDGGTKVYSNGPGHMTKMATMLIYRKNLKKSSSLEPKGWWPFNLLRSVRCSSTTNFLQMMPLGWPWPIYGKVKFGPLCFYMGKR